MRNELGLALIGIGICWAALGIADIIAVGTISRAWFDLTLFVAPGLSLAIYGCTRYSIRRRADSDPRAWDDTR